MCVAALLACLLSPNASAQSKVDLSGFFLPNDQVGDFKVYQGSHGSERRSELLEMAAVGKKAGAQLYYQGVRAGKVKMSGSVVFVGFEPHTTPAFARDVTARFQRAITLTYLLGRGVPLFGTVAETTSWVAEDLGTMAHTTHIRNYEDGILIEELAPVDYWFESGVLGGVPVP